MLNAIKSGLLKRFLNNTSGNFSLIAALSLLGIAGIVGAAVDYAGLTTAKQELQAQVDLGLLALARTEDDEQLDSSVGAAHVMTSNGYDWSYYKPSYTENNGTLSLTAKAKYETVMMSLLGVNSVEISATAKAVSPRAGGALELVLVLDQTNSMEADGKMDGLKSATSNLLDKLDAIPGDNVKISIVPFSQYVAVDPDEFRDKSWITVPATQAATRTKTVNTYADDGSPSTCYQEDATRIVDGFEETYQINHCSGGTPRTVLSSTTETYEVSDEWIGCVGVRAAPFNKIDGAYNASPIPGLLHRELQEFTGKGWDSWNSCGHEIVALTSNFTRLRTAVGNFWTTGNTYMPGGLMWGQRVLSPAEPFTEGAAIGDARKVMVLMTDGKNTLEINTPPYVKPGDDEPRAPGADVDTAIMCEQIKASGTQIYTIALMVNDTDTQNLLRNCASENSYYHKADDVAALHKAFNNIGDGFISNTRLTH
ncbi:MAG: hypothetical protein V3U82_07235 [Robiginitomaculum sp.]